INGGCPPRPPPPGFPPNTPLPFPLSVNDTPVGSAPVTAMAGVGDPDASTSNVSCKPTKKSAVLPVVMDGAEPELTVREAVLLVAPVPPSLEVMELVVSLIVPVAVAVTPMLKLHDAPPAPNVPPDRLIDWDPATAVIVPPPHEPLNWLFGDNTNKLAGSASVKLIPLNEFEPLGLLM